MPFELVTAAFFGLRDHTLAERVRWPDAGPNEATGVAFHLHANDHAIGQVLREQRPQVLVSFGELGSFPNLAALPLDIRRRWLHFDDEGSVDPSALARHILHTFVINATTVRFPDKPLVSVCTATCEPGDRIGRAFRSLTGQTYRNWEWVIYDDSRDDGRTFAELCALTHYDARMSVHRADRPSGVIGEVKRRAFMLGRGALLVELDHDDELAVGALADVVNAFAAFPDAGFAYSDWAEVDEHGNSVRYPSTWAFGYGGYRSEDYDGRRLEVAIAPAINARTIRHIVSSPNHLRAWRRDAYLAAGGHSSDIHVADDYELLLRTFLSTRFVHIRRLGYIQWHDLAAGTNTQRKRNAEIQRLVRLFRNHYHHAIHGRFAELGIDDFLWRDGDLAWNDPDPEPAPQANYEFP